MRINDVELRAAVARLQSNGRLQINDRNVLEILAAVGDTNGQDAAAVLAQLQRDGMAPPDKLKLLRKGLGLDERRDIAALLDAAGTQWAPRARKLLEALIDRAEYDEQAETLTNTSVDARGITARGRAGLMVEAINLSKAPAGRIHLVDTTELGRIGADGTFRGRMEDVQEGDILRLRTRDDNGTLGPWVTVRVSGLATTDGRAPMASYDRIDLIAQRDGSVLLNHNTPRPIAEPGAELRFTNRRTNESTVVFVTAAGSLPEGTKLQGQPGDTFAVAVSDGQHNTDFSQIAGELRVLAEAPRPNGQDLDDPAPLNSDKDADGKPRYHPLRYRGPLFVDGVKADDVEQGQIGDCYFPSAMGAIAFHRPEAIEQAITDNRDGTYTVRFFNRYGVNGNRVVRIEVDGDLYTGSWSGPVYGKSLGTPRDPQSMELWFPLIEKAWASWRGGYEAIGNGGSAGAVMEAILGVAVSSTWLANADADQVYRRIKEGAERHRPMAAGTFGHEEEERYANTGIYANHSYSVIGAEERDGQKFVKLRNPWGRTEPGDDGRDDGFFSIEIATFLRLYQYLEVAQG